MSLLTEGEAPGPVRFHLACDVEGCPARAVFDLVISEPPPPVEEDLLGHLLHSGNHAAPYLEQQGWHVGQGAGHSCPSCSAPREGRHAPSGNARRAAPRRHHPRRQPRRRQ